MEQILHYVHCYIIGICCGVKMHPSNPFLRLTPVLYEAVQDFRLWKKSISGGFQC